MVRVARCDDNYMIAGYTVPDVLYLATSNDPWGPVGTDMADIAQMTYNK